MRLAPWAVATSLWIDVRATGRPRPGFEGSSSTRFMSTRMNPPPAGGSNSPATDDSTMKLSGGTPSQPINARTPSASASVALARRLIVDTATPTSRDRPVQVRPSSSRARSTAAASRARSNRPTSVTCCPGLSQRPFHDRCRSRRDERSPHWPSALTARSGRRRSPSESPIGACFGTPETHRLALRDLSRQNSLPCGSASTTHVASRCPTSTCEAPTSMRG